MQIAPPLLGARSTSVAARPCLRLRQFKVPVATSDAPSSLDTSPSDKAACLSLPPILACVLDVLVKLTTAHSSSKLKTDPAIASSATAHNTRRTHPLGRTCNCEQPSHWDLNRKWRSLSAFSQTSAVQGRHALSPPYVMNEQTLGF